MGTTKRCDCYRHMLALRLHRVPAPTPRPLNLHQTHATSLPRVDAHADPAGILHAGVGRCVASPAGQARGAGVAAAQHGAAEGTARRLCSSGTGCCRRLNGRPSAREKKQQWQGMRRAAGVHTGVVAWVRIYGGPLCCAVRDGVRPAILACSQRMLWVSCQVLQRV